MWHNVLRVLFGNEVIKRNKHDLAYFIELYVNLMVDFPSIPTSYMEYIYLNVNIK